MSDVFLVYARDPEGYEPLVAVTRSEAEAARVETRLTALLGWAVSSEEFPVVGAEDEPLPEGVPVHIVSLGGIHDYGDRTEDDLDPVGLGVYRSLPEAEAFARRQPHEDVRVCTLPVGWIDPSLPSGRE